MDCSAHIPAVRRTAKQLAQYKLSKFVPDCLIVVPKPIFDDPNSIFERRIPVNSPWGETAGSKGKWVETDGMISLQHRGQMLEYSCRLEGTFRVVTIFRLQWQTDRQTEERRAEDDKQIEIIVTSKAELCPCMKETKKKENDGNNLNFCR